MHYCTDCYHAWQEGGYGAVQASIDAKRKPTLDKHECVGTAQLAALHAEVAEYAAFKAEVVALYTTNFMGKITLPDPTSLLDRINMDRMIAQAARTCMHHDGKAPDKGTPLNLRSHLTVQWLKGLKNRLEFRATRESMCCDETLRHLRSLEHFQSEILSLVAQYSTVACVNAVTALDVVGQLLRGRRSIPHPSASKSIPEPSKQQLDRIESLAKQAATPNEIGPFSYGLVLGAVLLGLTHFIW